MTKSEVRIIVQRTKAVILCVFLLRLKGMVVSYLVLMMIIHF